MSQKLYTVYQVADLLGATPGQILTWIREGRLDSSGDDGQRRIPQAGLIRFLKSEGIDIEQVLAKAVLGAAANGRPAAVEAEPAPEESQWVSDRPRRMPIDPQEVADDEPWAVDEAEPNLVEAVESAGDSRGASAQEVVDAEIVPTDTAGRLAEAILKDAVARRASAIHLEPAGGGLALRLRVDGVLQEKVNFRLRLPPAIAQGLVAHFLNRAGLTPATSGEKSGWFTSPAGAGGERFRLSVCPTQQGLRLVIFVTSADADRLGLDDLGLGAGEARALRRLLCERSGLILVTARPGGGAGTTLRAMAGELAGRQRSIFWIGAEERPPIEGASLIRLPPCGADCRSGIPARHPGDACVDSRASMSDLQIADAIRSAAGQDPDLIVVGEIWDAQTLAGAAEAAMAGRLVLGRLHERTAPAALELVRKSGLSPWRLATALLGVVAQTTARKLCPACRREGQPADAALNRLGLRCDDPALAGATFPTFAPAGCKQCFNTGYAGRTGVFSILEVRDESACLLRDGAGSEAICEVAGRMGMKTLPQAAMELARSGGTSVEELARAF